MGLDLTNAAVIPEEELEGIPNATALVEQIKVEVQNRGLPKYPKPEGAPQSLVDLDLSSMPNKELGQLYTRYVAYSQYVYSELAEEEIGYKVGVSALKMLESKIKATLFTQNVPKVEVPARVKENGLYQQYELEVLKLFARRELLAAHYKAYDKQAAAISRIITLRELDFDMTMRDMGLSSRRTNARGRGNDRPERDFSRRDK